MHVQQFGLSDFHQGNKRKWLRTNYHERAFNKFRGTPHIPLYEQSEVRNAVRAVHANLSTLMQHFDVRQYQCLVHGDFHAWNNMQAVDDPSRVTLIDWQFFGAGRAARDIIYFMTLSLDVDYDRDMEYLRHYHTCLLEAAADNPGFPAKEYTFEAFFQEWACALVSGALVPWFALISLTVHPSFVAPPIHSKIEWSSKVLVEMGGPILNPALFNKILKEPKLGTVCCGGAFRAVCPPT